jgi:hypothetical protein
MVVESGTPPIPNHMQPLLERVLAGITEEQVVESVLDITEKELGILLRALIRQRAREQWDFAD